MASTVESAVEKVAAAGHVERETVEREVVLALEGLASGWARGGLPAPEQAALAAVDAPTEVAAGGEIEPWLRGRLGWAEMRATALPVETAAARLGVGASMVRRVVGETPGGSGGLLGVRGERGRWLVFAYQLPDEHGRGGEPGSPSGRAVQQQLPPRMHPLAVCTWWDAPNAGLFVDGRELTPRQWLTSGFDVSHLVEVAKTEDAD